MKLRIFISNNQEYKAEIERVLNANPENFIRSVNGTAYIDVPYNPGKTGEFRKFFNLAQRRDFQNKGYPKTNIPYIRTDRRLELRDKKPHPYIYFIPDKKSLAAKLNIDEDQIKIATPFDLELNVILQIPIIDAEEFRGFEASAIQVYESLFKDEKPLLIFRRHY